MRFTLFYSILKSQDYGDVSAGSLGFLGTIFHTLGPRGISLARAANDTVFATDGSKTDIFDHSLVISLKR